MFKPRASLFVVLAAALAALAPLNGASLPRPPIAGIAKKVVLRPSAPLDEIPLYALDSSAPGACDKLEAEIDRLYSYATTMPSGSDRWAFQTRIYVLEKQLRPLRERFDASAWETLRGAVKKEWLDVQSTLPPAIIPVAKHAEEAPTAAPVAPVAAAS